MKIEQDLKLDFSDVLIRPKRSTLSSRKEVCLEREFIFKRRDGTVKQTITMVPIMSANMDTTGTFEMHRALRKHKMFVCLHKHYNTDVYPDDLDPNYYAISTGISDNDYQKLKQLISKLNPKFVCIDVANGYMFAFAEFCKKVSTEYPDIIIIAGNVVTREMVEELIINCGVDIVKVGIGSGSSCLTRKQTGVGCPQLSTVFECADSAHGLGGYIISDGGITCAGDTSKSFGGGADFVMCGSMFAGHTESGGVLIEEDGEQFKTFYGMSSSTAMNKHSGGVAKHRSSEGKLVKIPYKGPVEDTVLDLLGGIRSTCTYIGAKRIKDMSLCTTFIRVNNQLNNSLNKYNV